MAVKISLTRMGDKKSPFYRIVAKDGRVSRDGKYIELIGTYNPLTNPAEVKIDNDLAKKWLSQGAQPTQTVRTLLEKAGVLEVSPKPAKTGKLKKKSED